MRLVSSLWGFRFVVLSSIFSCKNVAGLSLRCVRPPSRKKGNKPEGIMFGALELEEEPLTLFFFLFFLLLFIEKKLFFGTCRGNCLPCLGKWHHVVCRWVQIPCFILRCEIWQTRGYYQLQRSRGWRSFSEFSKPLIDRWNWSRLPFFLWLENWQLFVAQW